MKKSKKGNHTPGVEDYKTIPFSSFLNRENKVPQGVQVVSDNEFYGNQNDTFDYAAFAHSKRKLTAHDKKVRASFVKNDEVHKWIKQSIKTATIHCRITIK